MAFSAPTSAAGGRGGDAAVAAVGSGPTGVGDIAVLRLKSHGHRFETPVYLPAFLHYQRTCVREGAHRTAPTEGDLAAMLRAPQHVFSNAFKREIATHDALTAAFGSASTTGELVLRGNTCVVARGIIVETEAMRSKRRGGFEGALRSRLPAMVTNRFTGERYTDEEVGEVLRWVVTDLRLASRAAEGADPWMLAALAAQHLCATSTATLGLLGCVRVARRLTVQVIPPSLISPVQAMLADFDGLVVVRHVERSRTVQSDDSTQEVEAAQMTLLVDEAFWQATPDIDGSVASLRAHLAQGNVAGGGAVRLLSDVASTDPKEIDAFSQYGFAVRNTSLPSLVVPASTTTTTASSSPAGNTMPSAHRQDLQHASTTSASAAGQVVYRDNPRRARRHKRGFRKDDDVDRDDDDDDDDEAEGLPPTRGGNKKKPGDPTAAAEQRYVAMTHKQLQTLCKKHGLNAGGSKSDIAARLAALLAQ